MTYEESAALMQDLSFRGRVKVACLKFAAFIAIEPANTPGHSARYRWAQQAMQQPDLTAQQVQPPTVMDPGVQTAGAAIDDAGLQAAVEATVGKLV